MKHKEIGQVIILSLIFMLIVLLLVGALLSFVIQNVNATRRAVAREGAIQLADAGIDKAVWQLDQTAGSYVGETGTVLGAGVFNVSVAVISGSVKEITATGYIPNQTSPIATKQVKVQVTTGSTTVAFNYAVQIGAGGLVMSNNSRINGSVYSNGTIDGANGARITGNAYSAGASGRIFDDLQIDGNAYAHQINDDVSIGGSGFAYTVDDIVVGGNLKTYSMSSCTIGGSAWYTTKTSCTVAGIQTSPYPGEPDSTILPMPISDQQITDWKNAAAAGGTIAGNYTLSNGATGTLGPKKITGNLTLSNNARLTLSGPIWVVGNISVSNNAIIALDPSYGSGSEFLVADGTISVSNNVIFQRAGAGSYIMMLTTNTSGSAFSISNNADALIAYASAGTVSVSNNAQLREVTAYRLSLSNNAVITYEAGLANVNFSGGPGGGYEIIRGTWRITD